MDYRLISVSNFDADVNIGDYIQALASSQFLPRIDGFIDRESLSSWETESLVIMNGWFMKNASSWPPSASITPLFVAFHINVSAKEAMLSSEGIHYLKSHEPIGCRDLQTTALLKSHGIESWFSGCMTLTLGNTYKHTGKRAGVYFVDPYTPSLSYKDLITLLLYSTKNIQNILKLHRLRGKSVFSIRQLIETSCFAKIYSRTFTWDTLLHSCFRTHYYPRTDFKDEYDMLERAKKLIKEYSSAQLVVTSRIHCGLPCLGLETPVIYVDNETADEVSSCRMGGLKNLFHIATISNLQLHLEEPMNLSNLKNKDSWRGLCKTLTATCKHFISNVNK